MNDGRAIHLSGLYVYPIKSCRGISLDAWEVDRRGLRLDRSWMLVDGDGRFLSQRELPRMALIGVRTEPDRLTVDAPGMPPSTCLLNRRQTISSPLASGTMK